MIMEVHLLSGTVDTQGKINTERVFRQTKNEKIEKPEIQESDQAIDTRHLRDRGLFLPPF